MRHLTGPQGIESSADDNTTHFSPTTMEPYLTQLKSVIYSFMTGLLPVASFRGKIPSDNLSLRFGDKVYITLFRVMFIFCNLVAAHNYLPDPLPMLAVSNPSTIGSLPPHYLSI